VSFKTLFVSANTVRKEWCR